MTTSLKRAERLKLRRAPPRLDLRERIEEELLENPLLEVSPPTEENTAEETAEEPEAVEAEGGEPDSVEVLSEEPEGEHENDPMESEDYEALDDLFQPTDYESFNGEYRAPDASGERDAKLAALENSPAPGRLPGSPPARAARLLRAGPRSSAPSASN